MYQVMAEKGDALVFSTREFETLKELEEYFEGFWVGKCNVSFNIYKDSDYKEPIGYLQDSLEGFKAVRRDADGNEVLLND